MIDAGVNVFKLIFSHADYADVKEKWKSLEILMMSMDTTAILGDLQGPKLRVGVMNEGWVHDGDLITFTTAEDILGTAQKCSWNIKTFKWCKYWWKFYWWWKTYFRNCWNR
jgi:pyruvate kinase